LNSLNVFTTANESILPWDISRRRNTNSIGKQNTALELEKTDVQSCLTVTLLTYCGQNRGQFNGGNLRKRSAAKPLNRGRLRVQQSFDSS
jgi:hypothetical protein